MRIALGQLNPTVGDIAGNTRRMLEMVDAARQASADLVVFPELALTGYPPRDLLLRNGLVERCADGLQRVAATCHGIVAICGTVSSNKSGCGRPLFNSAAICSGGVVTSVHHKTLLPNYDVFDEQRYFEPASACRAAAVPVGGADQCLGVSICEDLWHDAWDGSQPYTRDPIAELVADGAGLLINIAASPYSVGKQAQRLRLFARQAAEHSRPLVYVNQVGGNDELVFDGASFVLDARGQPVAQAPAFREGLTLVDLGAPEPPTPYPSDLDSLIEALVLGTRDYVNKCRFEAVVIGLSGGIDSAVTAAIARLALGRDAVHGVAMPSRYSSAHSTADSRELATRLGIDFRIIPIETMQAAAESTLAPQFADHPRDVTEENLQARIRGQILMALSNKFGWMVLSTGNKSELAVGYCTLYGDMCGGLSVISDVVKTRVYALAERINARHGEWIPRSTITKPPSAELAPDQLDQDSLPPYDLLDAILIGYVEQQRSATELRRAGFDPAVVARVIDMVDRNEYKRRQASPGLKVSGTAFGIGRRMPIAAVLDRD